MRVDVEPAAADEADQRDAASSASAIARLDGADTAATSGAGQPRLLQDLERRAAADEQQRVPAGSSPGGAPADDLVDGVVPADVLGGVDDVAVERAQRGGAGRRSRRTSPGAARGAGSARIASASTVRVRGDRRRRQARRGEIGRPHMPQEDVVVT
jgi:hypothetical protein